MREGRWVSRARGSKGARAHGRGRRTRGRGRERGGEIVSERLGTADRWGQRDRDIERGGKERRRQLGPTEQRESEGVSALGLAPIGGAHLSGTEGARGARLIGLAWAEMVFSFFLEFLLPFLFIFSRVFNSNSNQVSNSNQIKYVQQFKKYLGSI
jgi:hypothetical protein